MAHFYISIHIQTSNPSYNIEKIVEQILEIRTLREGFLNKKKFDSEMTELYSKYYNKEKKNFKDYADMNIRYLKASGIIKKSGRGIELVSGCKEISRELINNLISVDPLKDRLINLCNGSALPTDNVLIADKVLKDLIEELDYYGVDYVIPNIPLDSAKNINIVRNSLKDIVDKYKEELYAVEQRNEWIEIYEYMNLLIDNNGKEKEIDDDYIIKVPRSEAAAYLEWVLWRAFLAIDNIVNKPYEARGFNIDQDYLPVGTAPGGGPDILFEFENYFIVIEVTMSTNSRQEAMEGEPVRRHVADLVMKKNKPVYGIFIANKIDSNTAETFRIGVWFNQDDKKMALKIVPFTLKQFADFFWYIFTNNNATPNKVIELFDKCFSAKENKEGPSWKREINEIVQQFII